MSMETSAADQVQEGLDSFGCQAESLAIPIVPMLLRSIVPKWSGNGSI